MMQWHQPDGANVDIRNAALGETSGRAELVMPSLMTLNDGVSYIGRAAASAESLTVAMEDLDSVVGNAVVAVMKRDEEGTELVVLKGGRRALEAGRITHIVFEDHTGAGSDVIRLLSAKGYQIFSMGWSLRGPLLSGRPERRLAAEYEAPNYVATLAPDDLLRRCSAPGWTTLRASFVKRRTQHRTSDHACH